MYLSGGGSGGVPPVPPTILNSGQRVTTRCFGTPQSCPGKGMTRRCEQESGPKIEFDDYTYQLRNKVGYIPSKVELDPDVINEHASQEETSPRLCTIWWG